MSKQTKGEQLKVPEFTFLAPDGEQIKCPYKPELALLLVDTAVKHLGYDYEAKNALEMARKIHSLKKFTDKENAIGGTFFYLGMCLVSNKKDQFFSSRSALGGSKSPFAKNQEWIENCLDDYEQTPSIHRQHIRNRYENRRELR